MGTCLPVTCREKQTYCENLCTKLVLFKKKNLFSTASGPALGPTFILANGFSGNFPQLKEITIFRPLARLRMRTAVPSFAMRLRVLMLN